MTNITVLQSQIDEFLVKEHGSFQVHASVHGGAIDLHDADGVFIATLDEDEATLEVIGNSTFITI
tara:strand:- start:230 stop:424 length:195 start_codon:yes stop_codon:yes gene_type:complete